MLSAQPIRDTVMASAEKILMSKSNDLLRVARTDGKILLDLEIELAEREQRVDSICNGEVISIEPSLEAAFINFGAKRNGFLPLKEIAPEYYPNGKYSRDLSIKDILFIGQKILVQVTKEERGTKGAALTTYISLAGCYLVLMPNNPKAGGVSRRIEGDEREELKNILSTLKIPESMGAIIRTAGMGRSTEELQWDLDVLLNLWESIKSASKSYGAPYLIHQESDVAIRAVRDHLRPDIDEILIDNKEVYDRVLAYVERIRPHFIDRVKFYTDSVPVFSRYALEKQIETAFQREVRLPSGGQIVIDHTEALIAIDVNSAQSTKGGYIEETALNTNLEAADEIARQLRIRDLGGLIVIDFIDMEREDNIRQVEDRMRDVLKTDRARVQLAHISRFGLLEMSRQRLRPALNEANLMICPRCHGQGSIRNIRSLAISILHLIEEKAVQPNVTQIRVQVPVDLGTYLLNELKGPLSHIEKNYSASLLVIPNPYMETPQYNIECLSTTKLTDVRADSYNLIKTPAVSYESPAAEMPIAEKALKPAVTDIFPDAAAPIVARKSKGNGWVTRLIKKLLGTKKTVPTKSTHTTSSHRERSPQHRRPESSRFRSEGQNKGFQRKRPTHNRRPQQSNDNRQGNQASQGGSSGAYRHKPRTRPDSAPRTASGNAVAQNPMPVATPAPVQAKMPSPVQAPVKPQQKPIVMVEKIAPEPQQRIEQKPISNAAIVPKPARVEAEPNQWVQIETKSE